MTYEATLLPLHRQRFNKSYTHVWSFFFCSEFIKQIEYHDTRIPIDSLQ